MQLNITVHHRIHHPLREFVNNKFTKLEQYFDRINQVYVVVGGKSAANCGKQRCT